MIKRPRHTTKEKEQARILCLKGFSIFKIAEIIGCSESSIDRWCRDIYIEKNKKREKLKKKVRKMYLSGMNCKKIGKKVDRSISIIQVYCSDIMRSESECKLGKNNPAWNGGVSSVIGNVRESVKYRKWRTAVFQRDNWTCRKCGQRGRELNADHKKAFSIIWRENQIKTFQEAMDCKELWNIDNGKTLCEKCHKNTNTYGWKMYHILNQLFPKVNYKLSKAEPVSIKI